MSDDATRHARRTICEIASEFAPPPLRRVAEGCCVNILDAHVVTTVSGDVTCETTTGWTGRRTTHCTSGKD